MFDQLHTRLNGATYSSAQQREGATGAVASCLNELSAIGVNTGVADSGAATTVASAINIARVAVNVLSVSATFSMTQKQAALGKLEALGNQLTSLGVT